MTFGFFVPVYGMVIQPRVSIFSVGYRHMKQIMMLTRFEQSFGRVYNRLKQVIFQVENFNSNISFVYKWGRNAKNRTAFLGLFPDG